MKKWGCARPGRPGRRPPGIGSRPGRKEPKQEENRPNRGTCRSSSGKAPPAPWTESWHSALATFVTSSCHMTSSCRVDIWEGRKFRSLPEQRHAGSAQKRYRGPTSAGRLPPYHWEKAYARQCEFCERPHRKAIRFIVFSDIRTDLSSTNTVESCPLAFGGPQNGPPGCAGKDWGPARRTVVTPGGGFDVKVGRGGRPPGRSAAPYSLGDGDGLREGRIRWLAHAEAGEAWLQLETRGPSHIRRERGSGARACSPAGDGGK